MTVHVDVSPEMLRWAVERAGWDEPTIERRAPKFAEWTDGTRRPTLKQLLRFASDTHTPFGMLFLPEPPVEELPIPDLRTIGDTPPPAPSLDLLDTVRLCQTRQDWYRADALERGAEELDFVGSVTSETPPREVAARMRELLRFEPEERANLGDWTRALRTLIDRIEKTGVLVMVSGIVGGNTHRRLDPNEFRGFALTDPVAPLVFINGADTKAAQNFTIVHELAHLWLGRSALSEAFATTELEEERWCNRVAADFFLPLDRFRNDYRDSSTEELERLAKKYRVSTPVVLKRIFEAELLDWEEYRKQYEQERRRVLDILEARRGGQGGGDCYRSQPLRLSRRFARAVIASTLEGTTAYREAYQLLGTKKHAVFHELARELEVA
ncbi:MAG: ImmA/IrrE family metallo-endopeptidase [Pseudoclavibacter sp.]|nr:ImmA/IrrE family metallo-endopeptidase [Pseudoclavibacter sp.]